LQKFLADDQVSFATPKLDEQKAWAETVESKHRRFANRNALIETALRHCFAKKPTRTDLSDCTEQEPRTLWRFALARQLTQPLAKQFHKLLQWPAF